MALTALEKLTLSQRLGGLMKQQQGANALQKLTLGQQIIEVMKQLGYGVKPAEEDAGSESPQLPKLVEDFLADKFISQPLTGFTETLSALETYVGRYLTLEQVKDHAAAWVAANVSGQ